ncbi:MAG: T9SS type A sorting domain-containing protein [Bacteroidota bacterium]
MKGTLVFALFIITVVNCVGQNATPNPGFENWTQVGNYFNPDGWNNLNSQTAILGVLTCSRVTAAADVRSGSYAVKLTTRSVFGITANGITSTATLITTPPYGVTGGIPYSLRPDSITGWYKYTPASPSDSGFFQFVLQGSAGDTIGYVKLCTPNTTVSTYTRFSAPITYFSQATPVNSYWILSSSDGNNPVVNSALFVDDLALVFNPTSSLNTLESPDDFAIYPNPASNTISVQSRSESMVFVFDCAGRMIKAINAQFGKTEIDVSSLSSGLYVVTMKEADGNIKRSRFIKR